MVPATGFNKLCSGLVCPFTAIDAKDATCMLTEQQQRTIRPQWGKILVSMLARAGTSEHGVSEIHVSAVRTTLILRGHHDHLPLPPPQCPSPRWSAHADPEKGCGQGMPDEFIQFLWDWLSELLRTGCYGKVLQRRMLYIDSPRDMTAYVQVPIMRHIIKLPTLLTWTAMMAQKEFDVEEWQMIRMFCSASRTTRHVD